MAKKHESDIYGLGIRASDVSKDGRIKKARTATPPPTTPPKYLSPNKPVTFGGKVNVKKGKAPKLTGNFLEVDFVAGVPQPKSKDTEPSSSSSSANIMKPRQERGARIGKKTSASTNKSASTATRTVSRLLWTVKPRYPIN